MSIRLKSNKTIELEDLKTDEQYPEFIETVYQFDITDGFKSVRIDKFLTQAIENSTRTRVQKTMDAGRIELNGEVLWKANYRIRPGDKIKCTVLKAPPLTLRPENIPLEVLFEDEWLLIVNKPAGMVVHPGFGNRYGTMVNALLYHFGIRHPLELNFDDDDEEEITEDEVELRIMTKDVVRPGIVHRIDKETSGILVVAKTNEVLTKLQEQFAARTTHREYYALAWGKFKQKSGTYTGDIGINPKNRKLYGIVRRGGKYAVTDWQVIEQYEFAALLKIKLHTGRTHQIRVHFTENHHPLIGDKDYGGDKIAYGSNIPEIRVAGKKVLEIAKRQMLHAKTLGFVHPKIHHPMEFDSALPEDFRAAIKILRQVEINTEVDFNELI
jgi:23S rRNA pseudouridine1911/1915/1917 synthase